MIAANKKTWFDYLNICVMNLLAAMVIVPMWYIFVISTSTYAGYISDPYHLIPYTFTLEHYARAFTQTKELLRSLWVTIRVTVIGTLLSMLLTTAGGYALSKDELPGRDILFFFIILTMFFSGGLVPYYIVVRKLGLNNTLWSMILPVMMSSYNLILMKNYFLTLPPSLEEAARIDGYQDIQILFKIVLPISTPVLAAIALFYGVGVRFLGKALAFPDVLARPDLGERECRPHRRYLRANGTGIVQDGDRRDRHRAGFDHLPLCAKVFCDRHHPGRGQGVILRTLSAEIKEELLWQKSESVPA